MDVYQIRQMIFFKSWPEVNLNKNVSELQMFISYYNLINKEEILKAMRSDMFLTDKEKNLTEAAERRSLGNNLYKIKAYEQALSAYNDSISLAPRDSAEFGLALANRSAVFYDMEKYKECLEDINVVFKSEYPKDLRYKLFLRQSKCYLKLNINSEVAKSLKRAQDCVDKQKLSKAQRKPINNSIMEIKIQLKENFKSNVSNNEPDDYLQPELSLKDGENPKFLNASKNIHFQYSKKLGRHVVAKTDIKKGDVLFIEDPYAYAPVYEDQHRYTICAFCLQKTLNCIPCVMCTTYLYCSDNCRQKAWDSGHRWDCFGKRHGIIINDTVHACLCVLFRATQDNFQTKVNDESVYGDRKNNYAFINKLLTNKNKVGEKKLTTIIKHAVWMVLYLKHFTDYFDWLYLQSNRPEGSKDDLLKIIGGQLVKYLLQLASNASFITQRRIQLDPDDFAIFKFSTVGLGLYVSSALINHSCLANCVDSFHGTKRVIKATKDVKKGTEITISYLTVDHNTRNVEDIMINKEELERYMFKCLCRKCIDPDYESLQNAYLCPRCSGKALILNHYVGKCVECNFNFSAVGYTVVEKKIQEVDFVMNCIGDYSELETVYKLMKKIYNKNNIRFLSYYFACMQHYNREGDMKNCVDKARLKMELHDKVHEDEGISHNYALTYIIYAYVLAKYCKILRTLNAMSYEKYLNETKEMIKKCTDMLEYFTCTYYIKKFITDITEFLNSIDDDIYLDNNGFMIEECE